MMKTALAVIFSIFTYQQSGHASGCDWNHSGLELKSTISFITSGTVTCERDQLCTFKVSASGLILKGPIHKVDSSVEKNHQSAAIKSYQEYGSCYNDGEVVIMEVTVDGELFSGEISYNSPHSPI